MRLRSKIALWLAALLTIHSIPRSHAASDNRETKKIGVYGSFFAGDPAPSPLGFNLAWNTFSFLRFHFGGSKYDAALFNPIVTGYNYTLAPLIFAITQIFRTTPDKQHLYDFQLPKFKYGSAYFTTWGGGVSLFVPGWNFSPKVGVTFSAVNIVLGPYQLRRYLHYWTFGFEYTAASGFMIGAGARYAPKLKPETYILPYLDVGYFF